MKGKFKWKTEEPEEFVFQGKKYITVECPSSQACTLCDIGIKVCAFHKTEIPHCSEFNRADGRDVCFKKAD